MIIKLNEEEMNERRTKMNDDDIRDEHLLWLMVELMVVEWRQLEWSIMAVDRDDFDRVILSKDID